ncbi:hypothetical protein lerEdw1_009883 [Lerista edwardsae]|nr:hypothetical protein lerEdw1_009883 [Lerista edwardsae]
MENKEELGEGQPRRPSEYAPAHLKKDVATLCAIFLCFVGLLLLISSFASSTWIVGQKIKTGLWVICAGRTCHWYGLKARGFFAMLALTIFTGATHQHTEKFTYGTGAYTGWVSGPLLFISGAVVSRKTTDAVGRPE